MKTRRWLAARPCALSQLLVASAIWTASRLGGVEAIPLTTTTHDSPSPSIHARTAAPYPTTTIFASTPPAASTVHVVDDVFPPCDDDPNMPIMQINIICFDYVTSYYDFHAGIPITTGGAVTTLRPEFPEEIIQKPDMQEFHFDPVHGGGNDAREILSDEEMQGKCVRLEQMAKKKEEDVQQMVGCKPQLWVNEKPPLERFVVEFMGYFTPNNTVGGGGEGDGEMGIGIGGGWGGGEGGEEYEPEDPEPYITVPADEEEYSTTDSDSSFTTLPIYHNETTPFPRPTPDPVETDYGSRTFTQITHPPGAMPSTASDPPFSITVANPINPDRIVTTTINGHVYIVTVGGISYVNYKLPATKWVARDFGGGNVLLGAPGEVHTVDLGLHNEGRPGGGVRTMDGPVTASPGGNAPAGGNMVLGRPGRAEGLGMRPPPEMVYSVVDEIVHGIPTASPGRSVETGGVGLGPGPTALPFKDGTQGGWDDLEYEPVAVEGGAVSSGEANASSSTHNATPTRQSASSQSATPTRPILPKPVASLIRDSYSDNKHELPSLSNIRDTLTIEPPTKELGEWISRQLGLLASNPSATAPLTPTGEEKDILKEWLVTNIRTLVRSLHPETEPFTPLPPALFAKSLPAELQASLRNFEKDPHKLSPDLLHALLEIAPDLKDDPDILAVGMRVLLEEERFRRAIVGDEAAQGVRDGKGRGEINLLVYVEEKEEKKKKNEAGRRGVEGWRVVVGVGVGVVGIWL